jgi:hypothetical protein
MRSPLQGRLRLQEKQESEQRTSAKEKGNEN